MPIYTRCIQPQSIDPKLFTDRKEEYSHIKAILRSIILAKEEEERRLLIHGDRGTGKSILLRKVLYDLKQEIGFICVIIDGKTSKNAEDLLRDICEKLASQLRDEYRGEEKAISEISYLDEVSRVGTITRSWARSTAAEIESKGGAEIGLLNFFKLSLGVGSKATKVEEQTRTSETEINSRFLRKLLSLVIKTVSSNRAKEVVIAIDGLDQINNKDQIAEFVREIFKHKESLIIAALRSEAITVEFRRSFRESIVIKDLSEDALRDILAKRLENCPEKDVLDKKLTPIVDKLKPITGNPLSFLTWIHSLCNYSELNPETLINDLEGFVLRSYGFGPERAALISKFFLNKGNPFLGREEIPAQSQIPEGDYEVMIENGILVPDDLYKPRKYRLSSDLVFFKLDL